MRSQSLFFILILCGLLGSSGCGHLPWSKRDIYGKKDRELFADRDLYIIDGRYYVKVRERGGGQERFVEIREYLRSPSKWELLSPGGKAEGKRVEGAKAVIRKRPKRPLFALLPSSPPYLKRKVLVLPLSCLSDFPHLSDASVTELLLRTLSQKALVSLPIGPESLGGGKTDFTSPDPAQAKFLGEVTGAEAVMWGRLYGPFESPSGAFCQLELKLYETIEGTQILDLLLQQTADAPERALEAIFQEAAERVEGVLSRSGWFTRVARVDGDKIYILAGRQSGLREGDVLLVKEDPRRRSAVRIRVVELLGADMALAERIEGGDLEAFSLVLYEEAKGLTEGS